MNAAHCGEISTSDSTTEPHKVNIGEHNIVGVWVDEHDTSGSMLTWHVGVVESIADGGATVSYLLLQSNRRNKSHWMYLESAATFSPHITKLLLIICLWNIAVQQLSDVVLMQILFLN